MSVSPEQIETLRKLCEAATPGPWFTTGLPWFQVCSGVLAGNSDPHVAPMVADCESWEGEREEQRENGFPNLADPDDDAAFIAAARDAVPELIDTIRELEKRIGELEAERDEARNRNARVELEAVGYSNRMHEAIARAEAADQALTLDKVAG